MGERIELAATANHHHIPGTAYHWRHGWHPLDVATALLWGKHDAAKKLHAKGAGHFNAEPQEFWDSHPQLKQTLHIGQVGDDKHAPTLAKAVPDAAALAKITKTPHYVPNGKGDTPKITVRKPDGPHVKAEPGGFVGQVGKPDKASLASRAKVAPDKATVKADTNLPEITKPGETFAKAHGNPELAKLAADSKPVHGGDMHAGAASALQQAVAEHKPVYTNLKGANPSTKVPAVNGDFVSYHPNGAVVGHANGKETPAPEALTKKIAAEFHPHGEDTGKLSTSTAEHNAAVHAVAEHNKTAKKAAKVGATHQANALTEKQAAEATPESHGAAETTTGSVTELPDDPYQPVDTSGWTKISGAQGSNPGGVYQAPDGKRFYVKQSKTPQHARNEVLADQLYQRAGVPTTGLQLAKVDGQLGTVSPILPDAKSDLKSKLGNEGYLHKVQDGFATDAWLGNWDVAGLGYDNIVTDKNGHPVRVDPGGALLYRAQGAPKGDKFGPTVPEWDSLRDANANPQSAKLFSGMTDQQLKDSAQRVADITPEKIDQAVNQAGFDPATADKLKLTLKSRRGDVLKKAGIGEQQQAPTQAEWDKATRLAKKNADLSGKDIYAVHNTTGTGSKIKLEFEPPTNGAQYVKVPAKHKNPFAPPSKRAGMPPQHILDQALDGAAEDREPVFVHRSKAGKWTMSDHAPLANTDYWEVEPGGDVHHTAAEPGAARTKPTGSDAAKSQGIADAFNAGVPPAKLQSAAAYAKDHRKTVAVFQTLGTWKVNSDGNPPQAATDAFWVTPDGAVHHSQPVTTGTGKDRTHYGSEAEAVHAAMDKAKSTGAHQYTVKQPHGFVVTSTKPMGIHHDAHPNGRVDVVNADGDSHQSAHSQPELPKLGESPSIPETPSIETWAKGIRLGQQAAKAAGKPIYVAPNGSKVAQSYTPPDTLPEEGYWKILPNGDKQAVATTSGHQAEVAAHGGPKFTTSPEHAENTAPVSSLTTWEAAIEDGKTHAKVTGKPVYVGKFHGDRVDVSDVPPSKPTDPEFPSQFNYWVITPEGEKTPVTSQAHNDRVNAAHNAASSAVKSPQAPKQSSAKIEAGSLATATKWAQEEADKTGQAHYVASTPGGEWGIYTTAPSVSHSVIEPNVSIPAKSPGTLKQTKGGKQVIQAPVGTHKEGDVVSADIAPGVPGTFQVTGHGKEFTVKGVPHQYHYVTQLPGKRAQQKAEARAAKPAGVPTVHDTSDSAVTSAKNIASTLHKSVYVHQQEPGKWTVNEAPDTHKNSYMVQPDGSVYVYSAKAGGVLSKSDKYTSPGSTAAQSVVPAGISAKWADQPGVSVAKTANGKYQVKWFGHSTTNDVKPAKWHTATLGSAHTANSKLIALKNYGIAQEPPGHGAVESKGSAGSVATPHKLSMAPTEGKALDQAHKQADKTGAPAWVKDDDGLWAVYYGADPGGAQIVTPQGVSPSNFMQAETALHGTSGALSGGGLPQTGEYLSGLQVKSDYAAKVKLSGPEGTAIHSYTGSGYQNLNKALRVGLGLHGTNKDVVKGLDSAMQKYQTPGPMMLSRKIHGSHFPQENLTGKVYTDPGYGSTSHSQYVWSGDTKFNITLPQGSHGISVSGSGQGAVGQGEKEFILPRDSHYYITSDKTVNGERIIDAIIVPNPPEGEKQQFNAAHVITPKGGDGAYSAGALAYLKSHGAKAWRTRYNVPTTTGAPSTATLAHRLGKVITLAARNNKRDRAAERIGGETPEGGIITTPKGDPSYSPEAIKILREQGVDAYQRYLADHK